jgi:hypothetical protein
MRRLFLAALLAFALGSPATVPALISADVPRAQSVSTGGVTYSFAFPIWVKTELKVYVDAVLQTVDTHYSVTFTAGLDTGGSITFVTAPTLGAVVTIIRESAQERTTDFQRTGRFDIEALNTQLDRLTGQVQDLQERVNRGLRHKVNSTDTYPMGIPSEEWPKPSATKVLGYDTAGLPLLYTPTAGDTTSVLNSVRQTQTATENQTVFTLGFTYDLGANEVAVYVNGVRQVPAAYTETDTTTITLSSGANEGDLIEFIFNEWTGSSTDDSQLRTDLATSATNFGVDLVADAARVITASKTWDPANLAAGATAVITIAVTNASVGDPVVVGHSGIDTSGLFLTAHVTTANLVTVTLINHRGTAKDVSSGTLTVFVIQ